MSNRSLRIKQRPDVKYGRVWQVWREERYVGLITVDHNDNIFFEPTFSSIRIDLVEMARILKFMAENEEKLIKVMQKHRLPILRDKVL